MALVKCPDCGNPVSDKAKMCPHCGIDVQKALIEDKKREERKSKIIRTIAVCVVLAFIVLNLILNW